MPAWLKIVLIIVGVIVLMIIGFGVVALYSGQGAGRLTVAPVFDPSVFSIATVAGATSIAVLSFLGFDGISTLAEESCGGQNSIGRATLLSLLLVGVLFMLQTWIATDLAHGMRFSSAETAFYEITERAGGVWLRRITLVAVVIASGIANAMAAQAARVRSSSMGVSVTPGKVSRLRQTWPPARCISRPQLITSSRP